MAGLRWATGLDVSTRPQGRYGSASAPTTATEAAFGEANAPTGSGLHPGQPGGLAFWAGVGGVLFLILLYRSLPG